MATGEIYRQILVDGTYFGSWCLLIAHNGTHVIGWQWAGSESKASWGALIKRFPAPDVVVTHRCLSAVIDSPQTSSHLVALASVSQRFPGSAS